MNVLVWSLGEAGEEYKGILCTVFATSCKSKIIKKEKEKIQMNKEPKESTPSPKKSYQLDKFIFESIENNNNIP